MLRTIFVLAFSKTCMMDNAFILTLCGLHSLALAVFHVLFWRIFQWKKQLALLNTANRAIMQILNLRLIYTFLFVAFLCFFYQKALLETDLGHALLIGCSLFWVGRTVEQFIFLRIHHWMVHLLTAVFALGAVLFAWPVVF